MINDLRQLMLYNSMRSLATHNNASGDERAMMEATHREANKRRGDPDSRAIWLVRGACLASVIALAVLFASQGFAAGDHSGFGFNSDVSAGTSEVFLTGGGSFTPVFDPETGFVKSAGGFRCIGDVTQGQLTGCADGEGVRWDAEALLASSGFKCIGSESLKTAFTSDRVVVMQAEFYRAGDGNVASFSAKMFVSEDDLDPEVDGVQNVWIQGVGCGPAVVHFSS
ncbi:MAG: hypothetical protein ACJ789_04640 [Thermomicrobiales bacterium]